MATDPANYPEGVIEVPVNPATPGPAIEDSPPPAARPRRWIVLFGIFTAVLVCCLAIALLYARWFRNDARNSAIVVWGEESWEGADVHITGPALRGHMLADTLTQENGLVIRFHVPAGAYDVRVIREGKVLARAAPLRPIQPGGVWWPFRMPPAATQMGW